MNAHLNLRQHQALWKLRRPLKTANGPIFERHSLLLEVRADEEESPVGLGEASPLPGWSSEAYSDVLEQAASLPSRLPRFDPEDPSSLDGHLDTMQVTSTSLRFGLAAALMDYEAQLRGQSWGAMLGGERAASVPVAGLCSSLKSAENAYQSGVRTIKLKAGMRPDTETSLLEDVLSLGDDLRVRIDVNQGWTFKVAGEIWQRWEFAWDRIDFIEEPLRNEDRHHWKDLMRMGMPLAYDESIRSEADLNLLVADELKGVVVLKPSLIGTPSEVLKLARRAESAGFGVMFSNLIETSVTRLYCAHLAGLMQPALAAGLGTGKLLAEDWGTLELEQDAKLRLSRYKTSRECVR